MDNAPIRLLRQRLYGVDSRIQELREAAPGTRQWLVSDILQTHANLRLSIGGIALFFPFALWVIGLVFVGDQPGSISDFYWHRYQPFQQPDTGTYLVADAPVRVFFVGGLYAIGVFLIGYRGYESGENRLHTLAGLCAITVATVPMNPCDKSDPVCPIEHLGNVLYGHGPIHFVAAAGLFLCLAIAIFMYSNVTLRCFGNPYWQRKLQWVYYVLAGSMLFFPVVTFLAFKGILDPLLPGDNFPHLIYWIEIFAIVPFAFFWLIKTAEISVSEYDRMIALGIEPQSNDTSGTK